MKLLILFYIASLNPFLRIGTLLPLGVASKTMKSGGYIETGVSHKTGFFYISGNVEALNFTFLGSGKTGLNLLGTTIRVGIDGEKMGLKWFSVYLGLPFHRAYLQNQAARSTSMIIGFSIGGRISFKIKDFFHAGCHIEYVNFPGKTHNWEYVKLGLNFFL